jgi:pimeloyl-ACP methyl ester carboxylesterase
MLVGLFVVGIVNSTARSDEIRPVDQEGWAALKQKATLPDGETIAYVERGPKDGRPVVLIHGFTDNSRSWSLLTPYLDAHYRLIIVDLRAHGASSAPECCYALSDLAYDIKQLLDRLGIARADLVGHSLGSMVAQTFAQSWPERTGRLVLISSTVSPQSVARPGSWLWTSIQGLSAPIDPESRFMLDWYANPHPVDQAFLTRERAESAGVPLGVWRSVVTEMAKARYGDLSHLIKGPVLILWGREDPLFGASDQDELRRALPQARFVTLQTGHNVMWEQPKPVADALLEFLAADAERPIAKP